MKLKDAIIKPLERLIAEWHMPEVRQVLLERDMEVKEKQSRAESAGQDGVAEELAKLENRLSVWEDELADGVMVRDRFILRREEILPQITSLKEKLSAAPVKARTIEPLLAAVDTLDVDQDGHLVKGGKALDVADWRYLLSLTLERVTIVEGAPQVEWMDYVGLGVAYL